MIYVVGIASKGSRSLTEKTLKLISGATMIVGAARHLKDFEELRSIKVDLKGGIGKALARVEKASKGKRARVVVLATGDPSLFGIGELIVKRFGKKGVEIIPNVSIVAEAFARIKESWSNVNIISAHGSAKTGGRDIDSVVQMIINSKKSAVFTDLKLTPGVIARALGKSGIKAEKLYVFEALGTNKEKITRGSLSLIAREKFNPLNLMVVIMEDTIKAEKSNYQTPGIPDREFFCAGGVMTKAEVRAVVLGKLAVAPGDIVWDVGGGSGSVSIEASLFTPAEKIIYIEKKKKRVLEIKKNIKKFNAKNIEVVSGVAPASLKGLPTPNVLFVGGGGQGLASILTYISKRVNSGARVVVNSVTADALATAIAHFKEGDWSYDVVTLNVARSKDVGGLKIMEAGNPVSIITGERA